METSKNLFNKSIDFLKGKYAVLIFFFLTPSIIGFIVGFSEEMLIKDNSILLLSLLSFLVQIALIIMGLLFKIGTLRYVDSKNNNQEIKIVDTLKNNWKLVLLFFMLGIVNVLLVITPFMLLIIPGLILSIIFQLATFNLVLRGKSLYSSLALSLYFVKGRVWTFIKKALYPAVVKLLPIAIGLIAVFISGFLVVFESQVTGFIQAILLIGLGLVAVFLIIILIKYSLAAYVYAYFLFLEFEKTATPVEEEKVSKTKVKLMWATALSPFIALLVASIILTTFLVS